MAETIVSGEWKTSKTLGFLWCTTPTGIITMTVKVDNQEGYRPGDIMKVEVEIKNLSKRTVTHLSAEFVEEATYYARAKKNRSLKSTVRSKRGHGVDIGESDIWLQKIQIPPVLPEKLNGRRVIDVLAKLKVTAHVSGLASSNLKLSCPIIVEIGLLQGPQKSYVAVATLPPPPPPTSRAPKRTQPRTLPPRYEDVHNSNLLPPPKPTDSNNNNVENDGANASTTSKKVIIPNNNVQPSTEPGNLPKSMAPPPPPPNREDIIPNNNVQTSTEPGNLPKSMAPPPPNPEDTIPNNNVQPSTEPGNLPKSMAPPPPTPSIPEDVIEEPLEDLTERESQDNNLTPPHPDYMFKYTDNGYFFGKNSSLPPTPEVASPPHLLKNKSTTPLEKTQSRILEKKQSRILEKKQSRMGPSRNGTYNNLPPFQSPPPTNK